MLEAVRTRDHGGPAQQAAAPGCNPATLGTRDVDHVVASSLADRSADRSKGDKGAERLSQPGVARSGTEGIREQDITSVTESVKLLLQLDQHLRGSQPRIRRIVADE